MTHFEELRSTIMSYIMGKKPMGTAIGTYAEGGDKVVRELVKIRKLLEKKTKTM